MFTGEAELKTRRRILTTLQDESRIVLEGARNLRQLYDSVLSKNSKEVEETFDIVGPICETGDVLGGNVTIPDPKLGDVLVINSAGAYGSVMGSNYNTRPKIPEILIHNDKDSVIRKRETISQILDNEVVVDL